MKKFPDRYPASEVALIEAEERKIERELVELLARVKRECRPEFAERVETYLRRERLLPKETAQ